jgi:proteasome lid subunit RPN8/RPN11
MTPALIEAIHAHVLAELPREACGVLVWDGKHGAVYHPCRNTAEGDEHFQIHPEDWVSAEDAGPVMGVVHSHPYGITTPSPADVEGCNRSGLPWWIFDERGTWRRVVPSGWEMTGHPFAWGVQDCFTLVRDGIAGVPDFSREPMFWEKDDLFGRFQTVAGFEPVGSVEPGDVLIFSIRGQGVANHCAVYLGGGRIVHHMPGRLSREEDLGPLKAAVVRVVRRRL